MVLVGEYEVRVGTRGRITVMKHTQRGTQYSVTSKIKTSRLPPAVIKAYHQLVQDFQLYEKLMQVPLKEVKFVHFPKGLRAGLFYQSTPIHPAQLAWDKVKCEKVVQQGPFTLKTGCSQKRNVFVKGYSNLYDLAVALQKHQVAQNEFLALMDFLHQEEVQAQGSVINENLDIGILHFKFRSPDVL